MKAVRLYKAGDLRVEDVPAPGEPEAGWVRLDVLAAGICGSDIHNYRTGQWISRSPSTCGHELTGIVTAVGASVEGFKPGDTVVADSRFWCGECHACSKGRHHLCATLGFVGEACDGGFAEQTVLPARLLAHVSAEIDPAIAAMTEPLAVALHAVKRLAPKAGDPVLMLGCGPIGGLAALLLSRTHDGPLMLADRNTERAALVARVTGGQVVELNAALDPKPRGAIEATGSVAALLRLVEVMEPGGTVALVGIFHGRFDIDPNIFVERELSFIGCHAFDDELPESIALLGALQGELGQLIDQEITLDEVPAAYERLMAGRATGLKTIIRVRPSE
ncbi:MAG TPA: alcohol dehydrogenase catalytic domain-containing protein [Reyranella sp.]|nr:alcohol dehydrogenase catalytic domain-containing protein [Reyranella sp.]